MIEDLDISSFSRAEAIEYATKFILSLKQTDKDLEKHQKDAEIWRERINIAQEQGKADLAAGAAARLAEEEALVQKLKKEKQELTITVRELKRQLATKIDLTTNADALLLDIENLVGEQPKDAPLEQKFLEEQAALELEALKKKLSKKDTE